MSSTTVGSGVITPHDYPGMGHQALATNPPSCGTPYALLDIDRITAIQLMDKPVDCGTCLKVTSGLDEKRFVYVLGVDTGGRGLDLSSASFEILFRQRTDPSPANWAPTDPINCLDIIRGPLPEPLPGLGKIAEQLPKAKANDAPDQVKRMSKRPVKNANPINTPHTRVAKLGSPNSLFNG